jgi:hypothetical protein
MSTLAYRAPAQRRKPARRRRHYRKYRLSRWATFGTGLLVPLGAWFYAVQPLHWIAAWMPWAILGGMVAAGEFIIPVGVLFVLFCMPAIIMGGPFRQWRIRHRIRHAHHRPDCPPGCTRHGRDKCKSSVITAGLRRVTFAMDRNRCLYCGISAAQLAELPPRVNRDGVKTPRRMHVDHRKPWACGFLTTLVNMGLLCDEHNETKLNYYRERNGYIWFRPQLRSTERLAEAAEITRVVNRRSRSLLRYWRAAWAMG